MKNIEGISPDGFRDLQHMDHALRSLKQARSEMAVTRKPVVIYDAASKIGLRLESPKDLRMLKYAAFYAYLGARSEGLQDAAEIVMQDIREGVEHNVERVGV